MALTHQADAKNISKKVKRMLQDLNLASEGGGTVRERGAAGVSAALRERGAAPADTAGPCNTRGGLSRMDCVRGTAPAPAKRRLGAHACS